MNRGSAITVLACTLLGSVSAFAAPAPGPELQKWREVSRFNVKTPYADIHAGAARVNVDAPEELVRSVVLDYKNYATFMARFEKSQVVGRSGDKTDVYLQVPILKGAAKVWAVVRFEPIKQVDGGEVLTGHMIKGNVKRLDATWRLKKLDDSTTQVALELLIVPDLPVPDSLVVPEVRFAAAKAVEGSRDEAEKRKSR
jgi:ribosome-associated toxin RatA of RatAB toxin-antitoxin module